MDIKILLEEDGFACKRIANTYGGTYSSPCPWCGGTDRFRCWPNNGEVGGNYFCQKCGKKGGVKKYLVEHRGLDDSKARSISGITTTYKNTSLRSRLFNKDISFKKPCDIPSQTWQKQASRAIKLAADTIWLYENKKHVYWLNSRGISEATIRRHHLGFNIADTYYDRSYWGLSGVDNNPSKKMIFPAGIVIPHVEGGVVHKIKIRCSAPNARNKYHLVAGSINSVMTLGTGEYHIVVESELDGILLEQEAGHLVTVIVLGSAQNRPDCLVMKRLIESPLVLLALDNDQAGAESSYYWWMRTVPGAKRWPVVNGKDPGESFQNGVNIRDWIEVGIEQYLPGELPSLSRNQTTTDKLHEIAGNNIAQKLAALSKFKNRNAIFVDIITTGEDPFEDEISGIHLSDSENPTLSITKNDILENVDDELDAIFSQSNHKIFYGAKPQLKFLIKKGFKVNGTIVDQKIGAQLIYSGSREIEDRIDIGQMKTGNKSIIEGLETSNLGAVFQLEMDCIPVVAEMEMNGMLIDRSATDCLLSDLQEQLVPIQSELHDFFGDINLNSPDQLLDACQKKGIPITVTKKEMLFPYVKDYPILQAINDYRQVDGHIKKCKEILKNLNSETGRVHPIYNQIVDTGRMSCSRPNIHGTPKKQEFRELFIAPEGSKIIRADFSQIELRVAAEISRDAVMIKAFNENKDLHTLTASLVMNKPVNDISDSERQRVKAVNFGMLFGMGAESLQKSAINSYGVYLSIEDAKEFIRRFYLSYPGLTMWQQQQKGKTETRTLSNRRRIWKDNAVKPNQLLNSPIQGTAADILKKSLVLLSKRLIGRGAKIIGTIHDEILVESRKETAGSTSLVVEHSMIEAGEFYLRSVPVKVDVTVSDTWH